MTISQPALDAGLSESSRHLLENLDKLSPDELRRELVGLITKQKLGFYWEHSLVERDKALNGDLVFPELIVSEESRAVSCGSAPYENIIIEGDNFDALRLLRATHAHKIKAIYIDPPYNTGNKDWVYNDHYIGETDRYRHSLWLEFLYQRLKLARDLLAPDGVILVSINDENRSKLELLMDDVFTGMRIGTFVWRSRTGGNDTGGAFLSTNHEHVLVYGRSEFTFSGDEKNYSTYRFQDGDRLYALSDLTKAHSLTERENTYYPIIDEKTGIAYPCNPDRVWAYASKYRVKPGQKLRGDTIEDLIDKDLIWFPENQRVEIYPTMTALLEAIKSGDVPMVGKKPLLREGLPDLEFWVGRQVGFGRPRFKQYRDAAKRENQPISSWLTPRSEENTVAESSNMPVVGMTAEGSSMLRELLGNKAFPYPKPLSLLRNLLAQATGPGDTILDFFAGSGTTGHSVIQLNSEFLGEMPRRYILVSNRESTSKEPEKNLCLDVCAERIRRVIHEATLDNSHPSQGFAYLRLRKIRNNDIYYDLTPELAWNVLCMKHQIGILPFSDSSLLTMSHGSESAILFCASVDEEVLRLMAEFPAEKLLIYSDRPDTVLNFVGRTRLVDSRSYFTEAMLGQGI